MRFSGFLIIIGVVFFSCKKNTVTPPEAIPLPAQPVNTNTPLQININNIVNGQPLILGPASYTTTGNDTFSVSIYKYYISNVSLTNTSGQIINVPESYFLIDQSDSLSRVITLQNIPAGDYSSISFMVGVDAARNSSGAQTGALDPANGMFWSWNTGYIMAKMEGMALRSGLPDKNLFFHISGYTGRYSAIRTVSLNLPANAHIQQQHSPKITIAADLAKWFTGANAVSFSTTFNVTTISEQSKEIADNYSSMFIVTSVVN